MTQQIYGTNPRLLLCAILFVLTVPAARAACPVQVSIGAPDAAGMLPVTVSTQGDCGGSGIMLYVDGAQAGAKNCDSSPPASTCTATFNLNTSCWPAGTHSVMARSFCNFRNSQNTCVRHQGESPSQSVSLNNTPQVSFSMSAVDASWRTTATITAHFPTRADGNDYLRLVRNGNIYDVVAEKYYSQGEQDVTWTVPVNLACMTGPLEFEAIAMSCGAHWSVTGGNHVPSDPSLIGRSGNKTVEFDPKPTATLNMPQPGPDGRTTATISAHFPYKVGGTRYVRLFRNGNINDVVAERRPDDAEHDLTFTQTFDFACTSGTTTYQAAAMTCGEPYHVPGGNHVPANPEFIGYSAAVTMSNEAKPDVSVSYTTDASGNDVAQIAYSYPTTTSSQQRLLEIYVDGARSALQMPQQSGTHTLTLGGCWQTLRAVATACGRTGDSAFMDEAQTQAPEKKPIVTVSLSKGKKDLQSEKRYVKAAVYYDLIKAGAATLTVRLLSWTNGNGTQHGGSELSVVQLTKMSGTEVVEFLPPAAGQQVRVEATLAAACGTTKNDAAIDCACDEGGSSNDPVYYSDGNMRLTDLDPLPPVGPIAQARTYNSDEQVGGLFGRGWSTVLDQRLIGSGDVLSVVTPANEVVTFRASGGAFTQTWPKSRAANGSLTYDASRAEYSYRPSGGTEVTTFRAADGRIVAVRTLGTSQEARIAYDASGVPQTVTDAATGVAWILTVTQHRVETIEVGGRPDLMWTYAYDSDANLRSVQGPGNATWRTYEYAANRMTASRDALGNLLESHTYDADGYAMSSTGPGDEIASIAYGIPGLVSGDTITRVTYKTGAVAEHTLRPVGGALRPVRVTGGCASCGAREATYARDAVGRVVREQGADGYVVARVYDASGRVLSEEQALQPAGCDPETDPQRCRLDTDALAVATLIPTAATVLTTYEYADPLWPDRVTAVSRPSVRSPGQVRRESYAYHPVTGAVMTATVTGWTGLTPAETQRITQTAFYGDGADLTPAFTPGGTFDSAWLSLPQPSGLRKSVDGPRTGVEDVTSFVYYPVDASVPALLRGRLAALKNAAGHITHYESYDVFGNVTRLVDPNNVAGEMTYDPLGRLLTSTVKGIAGCDTAIDPLCSSDVTTARSYASVAGPLQTEQRAAGGVTSYAYDARGRVHTVSRGPTASDLRERLEYSYDPLTGKKNLERTLAFEDGVRVEKRRHSFAYDALAQLRTVTHADDAAMHYSYDPEGRVATVRDENHAAANTKYAYDPAGRLETVTQTVAEEPDGVITTAYAYDLHGNLTSVTDPNGNVTTYVYDDFGQLLSQASPVSGTTTYSYDDGGNLTQTTDANAAVTVRTYDELGRVLTATSTRSGRNTETVTWSYDEAAAGRSSIGRLSSMIDPAGSTSYSYERRGLLRQEERKTLTLETLTTRFTHAADGERMSLTYPSGMVVTYGYDYAGRPVSASIPGRTLVTSASYLPFGPAKLIVYGNGTQQAMQHDARYRLEENKLTTATGTLAEYDYTWDPAGNVLGIADAVDPTYSRTFGYDDLHRLVTANTGTSLWRTGSYAYDAMGNILFSKLGDGESVARQEAHFKYTGATPKVATVRNNDIVDSGEDLSRRRGPRLRTNSVGYHTVTHDAAGNELSYVATRSYSARNLLEAVDEATEAGSAQHRLQHEYDGRGIRVTRRETWGSAVVATTRYVYGPELQLLASTDSSGAIRHQFLWFGGRPLAQLSTDFPGPRWYFTDHLATPILQTDQTAAVAWRVEYEPYGDIHQTRAPVWTEENPVATPDQPLRLPGQEAVMNWEGTEERYNVFRWYRAGWGRYTQADPLGVGPDINLYRYAVGDPIANDDPLGLDTAGCDIPKKYMVNNTPCRLECCAAHDECFFENNCSAASWGDTPKTPCDASSACKKCNADVKDCFKQCAKKELFGTKDNPKKPNYFCGKQGKYISIPGDFKDVASAKKACECDYSVACPLATKPSQPTTPSSKP